VWTEEEIFLVAQRGHALFVQGRYDEATIIFEGLIAVDPSNLYCTNALAALFIRQGKAAKAVELLDRILEIYPNDSDSRARRCEALLLLGRTADAQKDWDILKRSSKPEFARLQILLELAGRGSAGSNFQARRSITRDVKELSS
jgi:tetratricopeptide (TPR) repeat protein